MIDFDHRRLNATAKRIRLAMMHPRTSLKRLVGGPGTYSDVPWSQIVKLVPEGGAIVEAGAADGTDTLLLSRLFPSSRIVACEPVPDSFAVLQARVASCTNVSTSAVALSDRNGSAVLNIGRSIHDGAADSSSLLRPGDHLNVWPDIYFNETQQVDTFTLDVLCDAFEIQPAFLWLDLQGSEIDVLRASPKVRSALLAVYMEVSRVPLYQGMPTYHEVVKQMKHWGFCVDRDQVGIVAGNMLFSKTA